LCGNVDQRALRAISTGRLAAEPDPALDCVGLQRFESGAISRVVMKQKPIPLRAGTSTGREQRAIDTLRAVSSVLTCIRAGRRGRRHRSRRVPAGNAAAHLFFELAQPRLRYSSSSSPLPRARPWLRSI
jgi:hypothetical protein